MAYSAEYFHSRVRDEIESWPVGILADYARLVELLMEFGPDLGMPHSRAMGGGLFELRPRGREGIGRALLLRQWAACGHSARGRQEDPSDSAARSEHRPQEDEGGV